MSDVTLSDEDIIWLHDAVHNYIATTRFPTIVGRGWDMGEEESREDFANFLIKHIEGIAKADARLSFVRKEVASVPARRGRVVPVQRRLAEAAQDGHGL